VAKKVQRSDKGFDFFDDNGKKITIEQYTQATGANGSNLRRELAIAGDKTSQKIIRDDTFSRLGKNLGDLGKTLGAGFQQTGGAIADVALQGGALLGSAGALSNPFKNNEQKLKQSNQQLANTDSLRKLLQTGKDIEGKAIVGTSDVDENATRIATGRGNAQDVAAVLGKGLEVANGVTMFANPLNLAKGAPVKEILKRGVADAGLFGATGGSQAGLQTFGQTGDLGESLSAGAKGAALSGLTAGALDIAAPLTGAIVRGASKTPKAVVNTVNEARPSVIASKDPRVTGFDDQYSQLAQQFDTIADPVARREVSKAMAMNRVERLNTQKSVEREIGQGGYLGLPNFNKPDVLYHGTSEGAARRIQQEGLMGGKANLGKVDPNSDAARIFLSKSEDTAQSFADRKGMAGSYLLRVKKTPTTIADNARVGRGKDQDYISNSPIGARDIEIKTPDGKWTSIQNYDFNEKRILNPDLRNFDMPSRAEREGGYIKLPGNEPEFPITPRVDETEIIPQVQAIPAPTRQTKFASQTAPNSGNLSDDLAQRVRESAPEYDPVTNQGSLEDSIVYLKDKGVDEASTDVLSRLDSPTASSKDIADGLATATALDLRGDEASLRLATEIYDKLSSSLTKAGQTVQAAKLINRRTAQGLLFDAQRQLKQADVKLNPEQRQKIQGLASRIDEVDSTPDLSKVQKDEAKSQIIAEVQREVNSLIPTELVDKIVGTWKAGLLTGIRTTTGGALSNALFRGLREVSRPGAVAADMVASLFTKKRSAVLTGRGNWEGTAQGLSKAAKYLRTGVDERAFTADGKYIDREINFKNKALKTYVNGVFRVMGAADRPFYYSQFKNSIAEATIVEAKNLKLKGKAFDDYVENGLKNPTDEATQYATEVANQSVLANDTLLSNGVNGVRQSIERLENPIVRGSAKLTLGILAPFTKVPSAFLSRVIDFTPIGAVKEVALQAGKKQLNQAKLVQAISEAGTGTGLIYLGAVLANNDLLTGNYPNDPKEAARWKAEGIIPNAIRVGDKYYSLNYAGPVGALFNVGKAITDAAKEGANGFDSTVAGATQLATGTLEQSFLSGISGALDAIQDPQRYAANFVKSQAGSVIPTLLNDIGNATDETQRQANNPGEAILSRIPGARTTLNAKSDAFGNELKQANDSPIGRLVDPLRPSNAIENNLTDELKRLKDADQFIYPLTDKTIKAGGETVDLTPDQQKEYNDGIGQETQLIWKNIINSEEYKALSDEEKKETLANAQTDISAIAKKQYLEKLQKTDLAGKVTYTKRQEKYAGGTIDPTLWIPSDNVASTSPTKKKTDTAKTTSTKKTAKKSSGTRKIGFKAPKSGGFKRTQSTAAIRKLLSSAGSGIKAKSIA